MVLLASLREKPIFFPDISRQSAKTCQAAKKNFKLGQLPRRHPLATSTRNSSSDGIVAWRSGSGIICRNLPGLPQNRLVTTDSKRKLTMPMIDSLLRFALAMVFLAAVAAPAARAQSTAEAKPEGNITTGSLSQAKVDDIIRQFTS